MPKNDLDKRIRKIWHSIRNKHRYKKITVCNKWLGDFETFKNTIRKSGYRSGLFLLRVNKDKPLGPNNFMLKTNSNPPKKYKANGRNLTIKQWSKLLKTSEFALRCRLYNGITKEETFVENSKFKKRPMRSGWGMKIKCGNDCMNIPQWAKMNGRSSKTMYQRKYNGKEKCDIVDSRIHYRLERLVTYKGMTKNLSDWARHFKLKPDTFLKNVERNNGSFLLTIRKIKNIKRTIKERKERKERKGKLYTYKGMSKNITQWADHFKISRQIFGKHLKKYETISRVLEEIEKRKEIKKVMKKVMKMTNPLKNIGSSKLYAYEGETKNIRQWADHFKISRSTFGENLRKHGTISSVLMEIEKRKRNEIKNKVPHDRKCYNCETNLIKEITKIPQDISGINVLITDSYIYKCPECYEFLSGFSAPKRVNFIIAKKLIESKSRMKFNHIKFLRKFQKASLDVFSDKLDIDIEILKGWESVELNIPYSFAKIVKEMTIKYIEDNIPESIRNDYEKNPDKYVKIIEEI